MNYDNIINDFDNHINKSGRQYYSEFYVGITTDIKRRLFEEHKVQEQGQWWIYSPADTEEIARNVEKHYLELGMQGGPGGGTSDENAIYYVYCYVITPNTIE